MAESVLVRIEENSLVVIISRAAVRLQREDVAPDRGCERKVRGLDRRHSSKAANGDRKAKCIFFLDQVPRKMEASHSRRAYSTLTDAA